MNELFRSVTNFVGGRKMFLGLAAIIAVAWLTYQGKIPTAEAIEHIKWLVLGTSGAVALEDGMKKA